MKPCNAAVQLTSTPQRRRGRLSHHT